MKYLVVTTIALIMFASTAMALDVNISEAGTLNAQGIKKTETTLNISGEINAADLFYIGKELTSLTSLDLSQAKIVAYQGTRLEGSEEYKGATLPKSVFAGSKISNIKLKEEKITISDAAFIGSSIETINLIKADSIGQGAFGGCKLLKEIEIPNIKAIGSHLFDECTSLEKVNLSGRKDIPSHTFSGCISLTTVSGVENIETIGEGAMTGCRELKSYNFSPCLKKIGKSSFEMSSITTADLSSTAVKEIGSRAFAGCTALQIASLPDDITNIGEGVYFGDTSLKDITLPIAMKKIPDRFLKGAGIEGEIILNDGIKEIGDYAMMDASAVTSLKLPSTLQYIGNNAMEKMNNLKNINVLDLTAVPALGHRVWQGIEQSAVELYVKDNKAGDFGDADQWKEFTFKIILDVEDISEDTQGSVAPLKARFEGTDLYVYVIDTDIETINLYNPAGQLLLNVNPGSNLIVIDTSDMNTSLYIVNAKLTDSRVATIKIAR